MVQKGKKIRRLWRRFPSPGVPTHIQYVSIALFSNLGEEARKVARSDAAIWASCSTGWSRDLARKSFVRDVLTFCVRRSQPTRAAATG